MNGRRAAFVSAMFFAVVMIVSHIVGDVPMTVGGLVGFCIAVIAHDLL